MGDLYATITQIDCGGDSDISGWLQKVVRIHAQPPCVRNRVGGRKPDMDRLMRNPRNIGKGSQAEGVVVVPVRYDDGSERVVGDIGD